MKGEEGLEGQREDEKGKVIREENGKRTENEEVGKRKRSGPGWCAGRLVSIRRQ